MSAIPEDLHTLRDFIRWGVSRFNEAGLYFGHGTDNPLDEAVVLVLHALHLPHDLPPTYLDGRLTPGEKEAVVRLFRQRIDQRKPAPYLTHEAWFSGLPFHVNEHVLIPRSPIAELIEHGFSPWLEAERVERVLDLCTGSGCIGIACAFAFPEATVDLSDISPEAIEVAQRNITRHLLAEQVEAIESDLFAGLKGRHYDLIVSNPPYVSREEMETLPLEYRREPVLALEADDEGLAIVDRILRDALDHLNPGGILVVEVGNSAPALEERYPEVPFLWLEFERGGHGVFLLTAAQLDEYQPYFKGEV